MFKTEKHATALGDIYSCWTRHGLYALSLGDDPSRQMPDDASDPVAIDPAVSRSFDQKLRQYAQSGNVSFDEFDVDPAGWTPFMSRIYQCCRQIAAGQTWTYKQLAAATGNPQASRAVGAAMARNRILLVIPCHRVIASSGQLRGFSAPGGLATKQRLLDLEKSSVGQPLFANN